MEAGGYTYKVRKKQREVESHDDVKRQSKSTIEPIQPVEEFVSFLNLCPSSTLIFGVSGHSQLPAGKEAQSSFVCGFSLPAAHMNFAAGYFRLCGY